MNTRQKIINTALRLFSEKGYLGTTTREIAAAAGLAEVTLFRHFSTKEKLFEEVVAETSFLPKLKTLLPEVKGMPYDKALESIASKFIETLESKKNLIRIMNSERHNYPKELNAAFRAFMDDMFGSLAAYFDELQKAGALGGFDPVIGARAFLGMLYSYFNSRELFSPKASKSIEKNIIKGFVDIFISGTVGSGGKRG